MSKRVVTFVVTANVRNGVTTASAILSALEDSGATLVGCNWAPDSDTIVDALPEELGVTYQSMEVVDLNPTVDEWRASGSPR